MKRIIFGIVGLLLMTSVGYCQENTLKVTIDSAGGSGPLKKSSVYTLYKGEVFEIKVTLENISNKSLSLLTPGKQNHYQKVFYFQILNIDGSIIATDTRDVNMTHRETIGPDKIELTPGKTHTFYAYLFSSGDGIEHQHFNMGKSICDCVDAEKCSHKIRGIYDTTGYKGVDEVKIHSNSIHIVVYSNREPALTSNVRTGKVAPSRYLLLHCGKSERADQLLENPPKAIKVEGRYFINGMMVQEIADKLILRFNPLGDSSGYSNQRYDFSKETGDFLAKLCKEDIRPVLDYIKKNEFRYHYNDIYPSKDEIPSPPESGEIKQIGNWCIVSKTRFSSLKRKYPEEYKNIIDFKNISPSYPAFLQPQLQQHYVVAKSKEEFIQGIATSYIKDSWILKAEMQPGAIGAMQKEWVDSLGIDFSKKMVIGVFFAGREVLPNKEIGIDEIRDEGKEIRIDYSIVDAPAEKEKGPAYEYYPYYDLVFCDRKDVPVVFYENGCRVGYSDQHNLRLVRQYLTERGITDALPIVSLSYGEVALAYPTRQFFKVERRLADRYERIIVSVDENGKIKELRGPQDYGDGLIIGGYGPEDRQKTAATAMMMLRTCTSAYNFRNMVSKNDVNGSVYMYPEKDPVFEVYFTSGGHFSKFIDHIQESKPAGVVPEPIAKITAAKKHPLPKAPAPTFDESLIKGLDSGDYTIRTGAADILGRSKDPRAIEPLIAFLKKEEYQYGDGVRALIAIGKPAVEPLITAFSDENNRKNVTFRAKAAEVLGGIKDPGAVEPLIKVLNDEDLHTRMQAAIALGNIGDRRAITPLIASLKDNHYMVGEYAAEALGKLKDPDAIMPLFNVLKDPLVRAYTAKALAQIDVDRAIKLMNSAMKENPVENCVWVIPAMEEFGDQAVEPLLSLLDNPDEKIRSRAANSLRNLLARGSAKKQEIVDGIMRFFEEGRGSFMSPDEQIALLELTEDPRAVKLMIRLLAKTNGTLPHELDSALHRRYISGIAEDAFLDAFGDKDENIRIGAAIALGRLQSKRAVEKLIAALSAENAGMRVASARALGEIRDSRAIEPLIAVAKNKQESQDVRIAAIMALRIYFKDPPINSVIKQLYNDKTESAEIREAAMPNEEAFKRYYQALKSAPVQTADARAAKVTAVLGANVALLDAADNSEALDTLLQGLKDKDSQVRYLSVNSLQRIKDPKIIDPLITMLGGEQEEELRRSAMRILYGMRTFLKPAPFIKMLNNKNGIAENRLFAIQILGELKSPEAAESLIVILKDPGEKENIKKEALLTLEKIKNLDLRELLLFLLERNDAELNQFVAQGLKELTGEDFGEDPAKMKEWLKRSATAGIPLEEMTPDTAQLHETRPIQPQLIIPEKPLVPEGIKIKIEARLDKDSVMLGEQFTVSVRVINTSQEDRQFSILSAGGYDWASDNNILSIKVPFSWKISPAPTPIILKPGTAYEDKFIMVVENPAKASLINFRLYFKPLKIWSDPLSLKVNVLPKSDKTAPLTLNIRSDKQVYEEGEPIIITVTIRNISKEKVSIYTKNLKFGGCYEVMNSKKEKILDCTAKGRDVLEEKDFIILEPNQAKAFKLSVNPFQMKKLKPDTYTITYYYYGVDTCLDSRSEEWFPPKRVDYPWTGTVVSEPITIQVVAKGVLTPIKKAWEDFLIALKSGDENKVKPLSTDRGYESLLLLIMPQETKEELFKKLGNSLSSSDIRWTHLTETSATGSHGSEWVESGIGFIKVDGEWKFDLWTAGN
ncbi:MAG: HEAT repeat domain-containing protein [Candidatus Omnitrophota bacterium]|nr:HEAT repeat domain-containing protein [Candidatus Omnitrophota bacterium]